MRPLPPGQVRSLSVNGNRNLLASGDSRGNVDIIDMATQQVVRSISMERQVVGDFDGDGTLDPGTYQNGVWKLQVPGATEAGSNHLAPQLRFFGTDADVPIVGDWDDDGCDDLGVFRPPGSWFIERDGEVRASSFGPGRVSSAAHRTVPVVGNWTSHNDKIGLAVFDMPTRRWIFLLNCSSAVARIDTSCPDVTALAFGGRWPGVGDDALGFYGPDGLWSERFHGPSLSKAVAVARKQKSVVWQDSRTPQFAPVKCADLDAYVLDSADDRSRNDGYRSSVLALSISAAGDRVAMCLEDDYRVKVWETDSGRKLGQIRLDSGTVTQVAYSPDGLILAVGTRAGDVHFYDAEDLRFSGSIHAHDKLHALAYSADGKVLVTLGDVDKVKVWNQQRRLIRSLSHDGDILDAVAISADSRLLATAGNRRVVHLWNLKAVEPLAAMPGHNASITALAISPDGRTVASGSDNGTIKLWDVGTRQEIYTLAALDRVVLALTFSSDGQDLVAGSRRTASGRTLHVWSSRPESDR